MFLGDHWIGCEPFMPEFQQSGVDAIVAVSATAAPAPDFRHSRVKYTEGRFLPYFFPDTFHEGGDPVREARKTGSPHAAPSCASPLTASATAAI